MDIMYCTITTKFRLHQCIALYSSLKRFDPDAILAVLCMDEEVSSLLEKADLSGILLFPLEILENKELRQAKTGRSLKEYCWTMKPVFIQYLLKKYDTVDILVYLDSDLYFFDDPTKLIKNCRGWNVLVTTHKVNRQVNSGFLAFRRGRATFRILEWWKTKCIAWCYDKKEGRSFGDQGHLDDMRRIFYGVRYINDPGANIAPWNCHSYDFSTKNSKIYVGKCRLVFFHFSGFRIKRIGPGSFVYDADIPCEVCGIYVRDIIRALDIANSIDCMMADNFCKGI